MKTVIAYIALALGIMSATMGVVCLQDGMRTHDKLNEARRQRDEYLKIAMDFKKANDMNEANVISLQKSFDSMSKSFDSCMGRNGLAKLR